MFRIKTEERSLGLNFSQSREAVFTVWAPFAERVEVAINPDRLLEMQRKKYGYWILTTGEIRQGDKYFYRLDGQKKYPDPASLSQPEGVHGPTEAIDLNTYQWDQSTWKGISLDNLIIYELHTGTFSPEGTFQGIMDKLEYLKELGITAIEIMPVSHFPGERNWGYDGVYVYAVQHSYGGPDGLRDLVQACHRVGIAVILDVVYNHNGPEGNYLPVFGPYFTEKYRIPWGNAVNYDDAYNYGVRQYYIENALMWFRDFRIDALRLDAVHAIKDLSARHFLSELSENVQKLTEITDRTHLLIGECDLNDVKYIDPVQKRGYGLDAQWCDEFHHALHAHVTGEREEYYADFGDIELVAKSMKDAFVFDGRYSPHRKRMFGNPVESRSGNQFIVFIQNHDQVGNRMLGERLNSLVDFEMIKLLAGTMFLGPYIPLIFMGEEYGESNPFLYFNSHNDPELIRLVREGRKNEFREFYGKGEPADPQDTGTFNRSKLSWDYREIPHRSHLLEYYKNWIRLRKDNPALRSRDRKNIMVRTIDPKGTLMVERTSKDCRVAGIMNFQDVRVDLSAVAQSLDAHKLILNSASGEWGGPLPDGRDGIFDSDRITINGHSILLFDDN
ncbi:MAG: malto-oligosyltrehalose trehalohydrolase [Cyclobacteriaceae bacterium]|nr:malto-oligosyltrehalose trehalohydrolase [Cyclobacteriaceae bacterium]